MEKIVSEEVVSEVSVVQKLPLGGRTRHYVSQWKRLTKDKFVIDCIQTGCKINFTNHPEQSSMPHQICFNHRETEALNTLIKECVNENIIEPCTFNDGDFMNTVFLVEKGNSTPENPSFRLILNMKLLNKNYVELIHHKMHSLNTCLNLMEKECFLASIDIKNAFYTIPMNPDYTKFLKFQVFNQIYQFKVLPMGFRDSPRLFCKILKCVMAHLHSKGHVSSLYIDDFFLVGNSFDECKQNVTDTLNLLSSLGFEISSKSCLTPAQELKHLGFILDSKVMVVYLSKEKINQISTLINNHMSKNFITVKELASLIGTLMSSLPGVEYGQMYYRNLECLKITSLRESNSYKRKICLTDSCKAELKWWLDEGLFSHKKISHGNPDYIIQSDSSGYGWGACFLNQTSKTQGFWTPEEQELHINVLELKACLLGFKALCGQLSNCHVQLQLDNTTAVCYITNMGGTHSRLCDSLAKELVSWGKDRGIWVSATHVAGSQNSADELSRNFNENIEWMLNRSVFLKICRSFGIPEVDGFASRANHQVRKYYSFFPDSGALGVNAFAHRWNMFIYLFPPFNLILKCLRKLQEDRTERAILIAPRWTAAPWWAKLQKMLIKPPLLLQSSAPILQLPNQTKLHPLHQTIKLRAFFLSGVTL